MMMRMMMRMPVSRASAQRRWEEGGGSDGPAWQQRQHPHRSRKQYHIPGRRERQDPSEPHFRSHLEWKPSTSTMWEP